MAAAVARRVRRVAAVNRVQRQQPRDTRVRRSYWGHVMPGLGTTPRLKGQPAVSQLSAAIIAASVEDSSVLLAEFQSPLSNRSSMNICDLY